MDLDYDPGSGQVEGTETLVKRGVAGQIVSQRKLAIRYALIEERAFRELAEGAGFVIEGLFGDYDRSPFRADRSPYSIWCLRLIAPAE
jgi:hypothetical protein